MNSLSILYAFGYCHLKYLSEGETVRTVRKNIFLVMKI